MEQYRTSAWNRSYQVTGWQNGRMGLQDPFRGPMDLACTTVSDIYRLHPLTLDTNKFKLHWYRHGTRIALVACPQRSY